MMNKTMNDKTIVRAFKHFASSFIVSSFIVSSFIVSSFIAPAHAGGLIRDAEVEHTLRLFADPILTQAGLRPESVNLFIVNDKSFNAFVAGGSNIFLHTGLILASDDPNMLLGVIAHETGHIAGGHLARGAEQIKNAQLGSILGFVLGIGAAAAGGGDAGAAIIAGSQSMVTRNIMAFSRSQEQSADQAALNYLDGLSISATGMEDTFTLLRRNEMRRYGTPDPYAITHPLSTSRIEHVRAHLEQSAIPAQSYPHALDEPLARTKAKLYAFLELPPKTLNRYPSSDTTIAGRMARAIAFFRQPDFDRADATMQALLAEHPNDAYLHDTHGQILFESGKVDAAKTAYRRAAELAPDEAMILTAYGEALMQQATAEELTQAESTLRRATLQDATYPRAWRLYATALGKQGKDAEASLALGEEALLVNRPEDAIRHVNTLMQTAKEGTPLYLRAQDIKTLALTQLDEKENEENPR